jgi:ribosomal protein L11 methyltransferase
MNQKKSEYFRMTITLNGIDKDRLSTLLFEAGCSGIEEFSDNQWFVYFKNNLKTNDISILVDNLKKLNPHFDLSQFLVTKLQEKDWITEWRKYFRPIKVGEKVIIAPPWNVPTPKSGKIIIIIDPQMAFGTGTHETTQLMIKAIEKFLVKGAHVLDAGTGSGILAILTKKLGAKSVFAYDIEQAAIENAEHNRLLNNVNDIEFVIGEENVIPLQKFNMILANINRNVLLKILPVLVTKIKDDGIIILSGILREDEAGIIDILQSSTKIIKKLYQKGWICLILKKIADGN